MILSLFLVASFATATAQTYKTHYIAPAPWQYWSSANEIIVSTNTAGTSATISKSDGTVITTLTPTPGNPAVYRFVGDPVGLTKNSLNTILNGAGIIVTGNNPIAVNVRNVASDDVPTGAASNTNDQYIKGNASLFSFGDAAVGNAFRVGYYRDGDLNGVATTVSTKRPVYSVLAIENNTTVKLNGTAITTLNAGQSYILQATLGSLVETSGPAVMNTGVNVDAPEACGDGAYNPVPPVSSLGNEYVVIRGKGNNTAEQTTIIATEANTTVTVMNFDHSGVLQSTNNYNLIAEGSFVTFPNGISTGTGTGNVQVGDPFSGSRIVATKNVVAYSGTANNCEVDIATLAPLSACGGSLKAETAKFRANNLTDLPYFAYVVTKSPTDKIYLTTNGGSPAFTSTDIETIPGVGVRRQLGSTGAYAIDFDNSNIGNPNSFFISSNSRLTVAMVQSGGGFSMSNFLSPFPEKALKPTYAQADCASALLSADPNSVAPFQWYLNGVAISGANSSTYRATVSGSYTITSTLDCGMSSQSLPVTIALCNIDLILNKTVDNASPAKGGTVNFTITVKNSDVASGQVTGTGNAIGVSATDVLPSGYTYVSSVAAAGTSYNPSTGLWSIGNLSSGQTVTLTIKANLNSSGSYTNTATVTGPQADPVLSNNTGSASVNPVDIALTSGAGTDAQSICVGGSTVAIQYLITGTPTVTVTGLGISGLTYGTATSGGNTILTINPGTVTTAGTYNYTVRAVYALPSTTIINAKGSIVVSPAATTPVFALGATSTRCQGYSVQTYSATASNTTGITYALSPSNAGVINSSTGAVTWSAIYNGTATITATAASPCGAQTATHTVTINSTGTITGGSTVCSGSNGTLTLTGAPATVVRWESSTDNGISWTSIANTTTTLNYTNIPVTTIYRAIVSGNGCTNAISGTATVMVTPRPVIANQTYYFCKSGSFNFGPVDVPNGTTYTWSAPVVSSADVTGGTSGTDQLSVNQSLNNSGTSLQTATYTVTPTYASCAGNPFTITVYLVPPLTASASGQTICSSTAFSVTPNSNVSGTTYTWTAALSNGTASGFSNQASAVAAPISQTLINTSGADATVTYTVTPVYNGCSGATFTFNILVRTATPAPTASNQTFCEIANATVANLVATGTSVKWYTQATGGTALAPATALTNGTYYASQTLNGCESATRAQITVTITATAAPTASNQTFCQIANATVANLVATGTSVKWYTQATGGTALAPATALTNGTYYASQTLNSCESATRAQITVTITATAAPTASNQTFCEIANATVANLVATGTSVKWYTQATGGTALAPATALTNGTYYASQTLNSCESATRAQITVTISATPAPTASNQTFCEIANATVANLVATGTSVKWYTQATGGTALAPATALTNGTYYASQTLNSCESATRAQITVTIYQTPKGFNDTKTLDCIGNFAYNLQSDNINNTANGGNSVASSFTWTVNSNTNVTGAANGSGNTINQTLINTSNSAQNIVYTVTPKATVAGSCVGNPFTVTVNVPVCSSLSITKAADVTSVNKAGNVITYTVTVANTGNANQNNVVVNDPLVGGNLSNPVKTGNTDNILEKGETWTYSGSYTVLQSDLNNNGNPSNNSGKISNTASVKTTELPTAKTAIADVNLVVSPSVALVKTSTLNINGNSINYLFTVKNTGNVTLSNLVVTDSKVTGAITLAATTLAPGASTTATASYTISATEKAAGSVTNTATVNGKNPLNGNVSDVSGTTESNDTQTVTYTGVYAVDDQGTLNGVSGGVAVNNVLVNDKLNGNQATLANVTISQISSSNPNISIDPATGKVNVLAGTPVGDYTLIYQIEDKANPGNVKQATVTIHLVSGAILAKDDAGSANSVTGGTAVANVLSNDTYNGTATAPTLNDVTITNGTNDSNGKVMLNPATGAVSVAANTPAGVYTLTYTITDKLDASKTSTATVKVTVASGAILAKDDAGSANSVTGGTAVVNVLSNDTYNGTTAAPTLADVTITNGTNDSNGKVTLNPATGAVSVAANTPAGVYTLTYTITDKLDASKTSTATVKVTVASGAILAKDDAGSANSVTGGTAVANVLSNDTYNGTTAAPTLADVTITNGTNDSNGKVTLNPATGAVSVAANTPAGVYTLTYTITDKLDASKTSTATVKVTVASGAILAKDDAGSANSVSGGTAVANVLSNDTYNGTTAAPTLADVTITNGTNDSNGKVTLNPATGAVSVAANTPAGIYTLTYTITDKLDASKTSTATVKVTVASGAILAKDDVGSANSVTGGTAVANVLSNDTYNGTTTAPTLADITITNGTNDINGKVTLNPATGAVSVAANTPAGVYTLTYTITDKLDASKTSTATVKVTVASGTILAKDDAGSANSVTGGTAVANVLSNDTYNGTATAPTLNDVTITNGTNDSNGKVTLDPATGAVSVAANTPAGVYTLTYTITDKLDASKISTA
ncbi:PKD-like domain-containing protein, partial [Pedobacter sp. GSP4]|uniref:PKD-like domain-containing protein n=1 Tax=Pedobacter sp. GSP4 TaxID=3453716 RepID=UPI003EEF8EA0